MDKVTPSQGNCVAQEHIGGAFTERRRSRRIEINRAPLSWLMGLMEGVSAFLIVIAPPVVYHNLNAMPLHGGHLLLYIGFAVLVGTLYGAAGAISVGRFLDNIQSGQSGISEGILGWTLAFAVALFLAFLMGLIGSLSRVSLISGFLIGTPALITLRGIAYSALRNHVYQGRLQYRKVGVIGSEIDMARFLVNGQLWRVGYRLAGSLSLEKILDGDGNLRKDIIQETAQHWIALGTQYVIVVGELNDLDDLERLTKEFKRYSVSVIGVPATDNTSLRFLDIVPLGLTGGGIRVLRAPLDHASVALKRAFDVVGSLVGLLLLSPLFLVAAIAIKLESPGPVFFRQARRGFNGEPFFIWKLRSMTTMEDGNNMRQVSIGDSRVTRVGRFIRATSIDELPQFVNVLKGEMSIVGPRPHALMHDSELAVQLEDYAYRQRIKPGITGWAQINGYRGPTNDFGDLEARTEHDLYYIDNWSIFLDCWIVLLTVFSRKTRQNAF